MLIILFFAAVLLISLLPKHRKNEPFHPPPGPKGLPLIANLHHFDPSKPHEYFAKLARIYGPILSFPIMNQPMVVIQSAKLAKEVLKTQDLIFCGRPLTVGPKRLSYNGLDMGFAPYGQYFREIKKICITHLLSSNRVQSFAPIRHDEVSRLIHKISSLSYATETVNLTELLTKFASSNICRIAFGKRYEDEEATRSRFHSLLNEAEAMFTCFFFTDYFPSFGWLDKLTGQFSRLEKTFKKLDEFYEEIINDHLDLSKPKSEQEDIIDILLQLKIENSFTFGLTFDHIKAILMDMFIAGTDSSTAMIVWAMTELIKNPISMKKVQDEIRKATLNKGYIAEDDMPKLEYFKAVVKETFRLHPVGPLLLPRETNKKTSIEGYDIRPKTIVYVNAWAIGRDPECWKDPEMFVPERFLGSSIDYKGNHFELIPFGAGRRLCPGLQLGVANFELALANLLYSFDWELPAGVNKEDIDTDVLPGLTMHKKNPLCLVAKISPYHRLEKVRKH